LPGRREAFREVDSARKAHIGKGRTKEAKGGKSGHNLPISARVEVSMTRSSGGGRAVGEDAVERRDQRAARLAEGEKRLASWRR